MRSELNYNWKIFHAAGTIAVLTFLVKILSAGKDIFVAQQLGTGDAVDAFLLAFLIPSLVVVVCAASYCSAFIPLYVQTERLEGNVAARHFAREEIGNLFVLLICLTAAVALCLPRIFALLAPNFSAEKMQLTVELGYLLLPAIVLGGMIQLYGALLNTRERFAFAAVAPVFPPILMAVWLYCAEGDMQRYALGYGAVSGMFLQCVAVMYALDCAGLPLMPHWPAVTPRTREILRQYLAVFAGAILMSSTDIIDQAMAASLGAGSLAHLSYGTKVITLVLGVGSTALGTAVFPYFSRMVAENDWIGLLHTLRTYVRLILLATLPVLLFLLGTSQELVRVLFERGAFVPSDTEVAALVQSAAALQIPFYVLAIFFVRLISALRLNYLLVASTVVSVILNIALNLYFSRLFGVAGIALSTSVVYAWAALFSGIALLILLKRRIAEQNPNRTGAL